MGLKNFRYYGFYLMDAINGFKIKSHIKEIANIQENFTSEESQKKQKTNLTNLFFHASNDTLFYSDYKNLKLEEFPVINKNIIRNNFQLFESKKYKNKKKYKVSSSGSTGVSILVYQNRNKKARNNADNIYFSRLTGFEVGNKLIYIRIWWYKISYLQMWFKNIIPIDVLRFNDTNYISSLMDKLSQISSNIYMIGYASAFEKICVYLEQHKLKSNILPNAKSAIAISESLNNYTKQKMKYYFNISVFSRYSNSENGIIAQQIPGSENDFVINWASYYVEILKFDEDKPVEKGEIGRIVVTDLFNYCFPIIRYDTGDVGSLNDSVSPPTFQRIEGRKADIILNTKGEIVSSLIIVRPHLSKGVIQSQLIQEDSKAYVLKLQVTSDFNDALTLIQEFKSILGNDANIKIKYINEIPPLASGKARATINNYLAKTSNSPLNKK
tara:strand:- start:114 stop:1436 length:1323 start_codon:yes stop_codon:yes gene_type:complete